MSVTAQTQPQFITITPLYRSNNNKVIIKYEIIYQNVSIHVELVSVGSCRDNLLNMYINGLSVKLDFAVFTI